MPPRKGGKGKKKVTKRQEIDEDEENLQEDDDLLNLGGDNVPGMDQEELTQEEKEEMLFKVLNSNNPQAPHNLTKFSFKERCFKTEEIVDQLVFHYSVEGNILLNESDEARDQEEYLEKKKAHDVALLNKINAAIKAEGGKVPHDDETSKKKSLRNMFNYQERTSQTFNLPIRERGIKTDPPQTSVFSVETTQW